MADQRDRERIRTIERLLLFTYDHLVNVDDEERSDLAHDYVVEAWTRLIDQYRPANIDNPRFQTVGDIIRMLAKRDGRWKD